MQNNMDWHSEQWKDAGWSKMKLILDQEMPQKKRRRGFFWLWFGLAGITLVASTLIWFNTNSDPDARSEVNIELSSSSKEFTQTTKIEDNDKNQRVQSLENQSEQPMGLSSGNIDQNTSSANQGKSLESKTFLPRDKKTQTNDIVNSSLVQAKNIIETEKQANKLQKDVSKNQTVPFEERNKNAHQETERSHPISVSLLSLIPIRLNTITAFNRHLKFNSFPSENDKNEGDTEIVFQSNWKVLVFAGGFMGLDQYQHGFHTGAGLRFNFAKRWSLDFGVAWGRHQFSNLGFFDRYDDAILEPGAVEDFNNEFTVPQYDPLNQTQKALSFLDVPVQLKFSFWGDWYFYSGYQYSYLLNIGQAGSIQEADLAVTEQEQRAFIPDPVDRKLIEKHYHSLAGGLGTHIGRVSIQAGYNHGLTNLISEQVETESKIFRRAFDLKIFYQF